MPTSSQSKILSAVDYQIQQQGNPSEGATKPSVPLKSLRPSKGNNYDDEEERISPPPTVTRRRSSGKINEAQSSSRSNARSDFLHMPVIDLNQMAPHEPRSIMKHSDRRRSSVNEEGTEHRPHPTKRNSSPVNSDEQRSSDSDGDDDAEARERQRRTSLLTDNTRRLLVLGSIRPSRTFYKDLPEGDVEYLMEYFRRMRQHNRKMTSEEINQELTTKLGEYKPKIFFDSSCVTKTQVRNIEQLIQPHADQIRSQQAEFGKLERPVRFVIKQRNSDAVLLTIPSEYNDCFLTLVNRSDPLRKSELVTELVREKLLDEIKDNSLDISYFPGGVNYDVPREEINEQGQMELDTYKSIKKRLSGRRVWYFSAQPERKANALIAVLPLDYSLKIDHRRLLEILYERLKSLSSEEDVDVQRRIVSLEFVPLSCVFSSFDMANQFIVDCDGSESKEYLLSKPLKFTVNKQSLTLELHSYDEFIQREYNKYLKAEKYRELIKNHDEAVKRTVTTK